MQPHKEVLVLTLDLTEVLEGHEQAMAYLSSYTPFVDMLYGTAVLDTLPLQMSYACGHGDFSRAFLNLYENVSGIGPEDLPDWVMDHLDALCEATMEYLTKYVDFAITQAPQFETLEIIDSMRLSPGKFVVTAVRAPIFQQARKSDEVLRRLENIQAALEEMYKGFRSQGLMPLEPIEGPRWTLNGVLCAEDDLNALSSDSQRDVETRGSTHPSTVTPEGSNPSV